MTTRYAVVPSPGGYFSGARVWALRMCDDLDTARNLASRWSDQYERNAPPYGGAPGRYRVIKTDAETLADAVWIGWKLSDKASL